MIRSAAVAVAFALLVACGRSPDGQPVSGASDCRSLDVVSSRTKAEDGDLLAIRQMRDYSLDCLLHDNAAEVLRWGKLAAEKGSEQDEATYESIKLTFVPQQQRSAPFE